MAISDDTTQIPYGYCQCGCGQKTKLARQSHTKSKHTRGEPFKYIFGHSTKKKPLEQRIAEFWNRVNKDGSIPVHCLELGQCWEWTGSHDKDGYGQFSYTTGKQRATRIMWVFIYGEIPDGLFVLHKCDNPKCVRPDHLWLGTNIDNMRDRSQKGRQCRGEKQRNAKLTETQIIDIRRRYAVGNVSYNVLSAEYHINKTTISQIILRKTWKHLK